MDKKKRYTSEENKNIVRVEFDPGKLSSSGIVYY